MQAAPPCGPRRPPTPPPPPPPRPHRRRRAGPAGTRGARGGSEGARRARPRAAGEVAGEEPAGHGRIPRPAPSLPSEGCSASPPPFPCARAEGRRTGLGAAGTAAPPAGEPRNSPSRSTEPGARPCGTTAGKDGAGTKSGVKVHWHQDIVISALRGLYAAWVFLLRSRFKLIPYSSITLFGWGAGKELNLMVSEMELLPRNVT